jgi:hypothetical protein
MPLAYPQIELETPSMYLPPEQKKATRKLPISIPTQDTSSILMKRLPITPLDQTELTPQKETKEEAEEDTPLAQEGVEVAEEEEEEAEEALQAQEEDTMVKINCSANTPTRSLEIAQKCESF